MTEKDLNDYKLSLDKMTNEELVKLEQDLVEDAKKIDTLVAETTYELSDENYPLVAESIRYFLDKQTVQWQYALAMIGMYEFWNPEKRPESIPYPQLDAVLRTLGNLQFTGFDEWARVVAINKYFEPLREGYVNTTTMIYDCATKHNAVMDKLGLNTPVEHQA